MESSEYIFPQRLTRRDFLKMTGVASVGLALPGAGRAQGRGAPAPARIGSGYHTYDAVPGWGALTDGRSYGYGCGVVVDAKDRVYVTSRSGNPVVSIWDKDGKLLETWSGDFAAKVGYTIPQMQSTVHGLYLSKEGRDEFLYWTETCTDRRQAPVFGARVYKTDLQGKVLFTIGNVAAESSASRKFDFTDPTDLAVAPNGDIYVVDGYGSQRVTRFDKNFSEIKTIGGRGREHGQFNTCHGIWINTLRKTPEVYIADRQNSRIEVFSLELEYVRTVLENEVRYPSCFYQFKDKLYIPDLASRVTIIDAQDQVVANLGDGRDLPDNQTNPALFAEPHALTVDSRGDMYVVEWVDFGRPRKFKLAPQKA